VRGDGRWPATPACDGAVAYRDTDAVRADIANLRAALAGTGAEEAFLSCRDHGYRLALAAGAARVRVPGAGADRSDAQPAGPARHAGHRARLGPPKYVPGPPKRFAQGVGAALITVAAVLALGFGAGGGRARRAARGRRHARVGARALPRLPGLRAAHARRARPGGDVRTLRGPLGGPGAELALLGSRGFVDTLGDDITLGTTGFDVVDSQGWLRVEVPGGLVKHPENQYVRTLTSTPSPLSP
jgi:hypothetical protein